MTNKRLLISHSTHYRFDRPVTYALQRLKLRPKDNAGQTVVDWDIDIDGGKIQSACEDAHLNHVALVSVDSGRTEISIKCSGAVETSNSDGIIGKHRGNIPLWCFLKPTRMTTAGKAVAKMLGGFKIDAANELAGLHILSDIIREYLPPREAGVRIGFVMMATILGMAAGGWLSGLIFDTFASYRMAFLNGLAWNLVNVSIAVFLLMKSRTPRAAAA